MFKTKRTVKQTEGIIYQAGYPVYGSVKLTKEHAVHKSIGSFLVIGGLFTLIFFASPMLIAESYWRVSQLFSRKTNGVVLDSKFSQLIKASDVNILAPVDREFSIIIPKIGVNSKVYANTSTTNEKIYDNVLKQGIAHAANSYLPGEDGEIVLFGHSTNSLWNSTKLNAVFYLLKELEPNDQINLVYKNERYVYRVTDKRIAEANDVSSIKGNKDQSLLLFTCWPPGTTWKRLIVEAERI